MAKFALSLLGQFCGLLEYPPSLGTSCTLPWSKWYIFNWPLISSSLAHFLVAQTSQTLFGSGGGSGWLLALAFRFNDLIWLKPNPSQEISFCPALVELTFFSHRRCFSSYYTIWDSLSSKLDSITTIQIMEDSSQTL